MSTLETQIMEAHVLVITVRINESVTDATKQVSIIERVAWPDGKLILSTGRDSGGDSCIGRFRRVVAFIIATIARS